MPKNPATCTIAAGEALSSSVDLTSGMLAMLFAPPSWNGANVSFQVSPDGSHWADLVDDNGAEVTRTMLPGTAVPIDPELSEPALYVRIRSGHRNAPVEQPTDQTFTLVLI